GKLHPQKVEGSLIALLKQGDHIHGIGCRPGGEIGRHHDLSHRGGGEDQKQRGKGSEQAHGPTCPTGRCRVKPQRTRSRSSRTYGCGTMSVAAWHTVWSQSRRAVSPLGV